MKYTILIITTLFLSSCSTYNPDKRSINLIKTKELVNLEKEGKYKYTIETTFSDIFVTNLYSDSNWNVGDTLKIIKY